MYTVKVNLQIPFEIQNVEGGSKYDAIENVREILMKTLPYVIADNLQRIQEESIFEVLGIEED